MTKNGLKIAVTIYDDRVEGSIGDGERLQAAFTYTLEGDPTPQDLAAVLKRILEGVETVMGPAPDSGPEPH